jgi:tRNA(Ile)-lysidine synthase
MPSRSHPPTLLTLTRALVRDASLISKGERVLVALSGGPDSMALLHVLARLRKDLGCELVAHGVDHGLREDASRELDVAADFARALDVPFERTRVALTDGGNLQARARALRYDALEAAARASGCDVIATAHHADDRAETVLLRLLRGAGPRGLAVLPARARAVRPNADRIRPFLRARRADIDAHLRRHAVPFATDPSNANPRFARTRVRHELMPLLESLSPSIVLHLNALADQLEALAPRDLPAPPALGALLDLPSALPRATRVALDALAAGRTPRAKVQVTSGLVAVAGRDQVELMASAASTRGSRKTSSRVREGGSDMLGISWKHPSPDGRHHK